MTSHRFVGAGFVSILYNYFNRSLGLSESLATSATMAGVALSTGMSMVGGNLADSFFGHSKTLRAGVFCLMVSTSCRRLRMTLSRQVLVRSSAGGTSLVRLRRRSGRLLSRHLLCGHLHGIPFGLLQTLHLHADGRPVPSFRGEYQERSATITTDCAGQIEV